MTFSILLHFAGAIFCGALAFFALLRNRRSFVNVTFAVGMVLLALESLFAGLSIRSPLPAEMIYWQRWRWGTAALLPGSWLLFGLTFAQRERRAILATWKWPVFASFALPLTFVSLFAADFFVSLPRLHGLHTWVIPIGWSGYIYHALFLLSLVLIMVLLERTLRASEGMKRRKVKFLVLGISGLFAARVYTVSQTLLFCGINLDLEVINAVVLLVANVLIMIPFLRDRITQMDIYVSQTALYRSVTLVGVGAYLFAVGFLAKIIGYGGSGLSLPLVAVFIFLAVMVLLILVLSDELRQKMRRFISLHFQRPRYDYREAWMTFTRRTACIVKTRDLCDTVTKIVSEMLDAPAVSIWLADETDGGLKLGGSTVFSDAQTPDLPLFQKGAADLMHAIGDRQTPADFQDRDAGLAEELNRANPDFLEKARIRLCVPLVAGNDLLGIMTLDERSGRESFSFEEIELLKTVADQVAGSLLNLKLSERLREAKEMESFQRISAFFVHDLKNLASKFSMMLQNLPSHFDNPEFREDAVRLMSQGVAKINRMCNQLSLLREGLELRPRDADLNDLVKATLAGFDGVLKAPIVKDLHPLPKVLLDPEQIQKVLNNLVLNAEEALGNGGEICVRTGKVDGWVELAVSDDGCGMPRDFIEQALFRPFKTTKKHGIGIGLFHSKMIVEAHKGRIEVQSEEGKGSTFRVLLPVDIRQD